MVAGSAAGSYAVPMAKLRIKCSTRAHAPGQVNFPLPTVADAEVVLVEDDGSERPLPGLIGVAWKVEGGQTTEATLRFEAVELGP